MLDVRTVTIVDPASEDLAEQHAAGPRLASLQGARIGLIDNSKRRADTFLDELQTLLRDHYEVAGFEYYRKASASVPTPPEVLRRLVDSCDAVIHGVAD